MKLINRISGFILIIAIVNIKAIFTQNNTRETISNEEKIKKLEKQLNELDILYNNLLINLDNTKNQNEKAVNSLNESFNNLSKESQTNSNKALSQIQAIETYVKINENQKNDLINQNVDRNITIQENFYKYITFYGDKYSQLDEKITNEELVIELRKIINPQSGSLGFKLSDKLNQTMQKYFYLMVDEIMRSNNKNIDKMKKKIDNTINSVTSTLNDPLVSGLVDVIPYGTSVKNIVGTISGLVVNMFDDNNVKESFKEKILEKVKSYQTEVLKDISPIISFYDKMAKLDNQYELTLQNIRKDVSILGLELKEFCISLETPLKKIDPAFSIDKTEKNVYAITIKIADKFENICKDKTVNKNNLNILTNISNEVKNRSRVLYNRYREIQESKIIANNNFVLQFKEIINKSKITTNEESLSNQLEEKNNKLMQTMNQNHLNDKYQFEKYLDKIYELN